MGEMGLFFRLCKLVFIGKSLVKKGGQNPLEAAKLNCTILHGPHMWNFQEIKEQLFQSGGAIEVADEAALADALSNFFKNSYQASKIAQNAYDYAQSEAHVLDVLILKLAPFIMLISEQKGRKNESP
jgi:3-deoxy-D-manno-octulosonic-acid transferase